ncbi:MAG: hypothetical protein V1821_02015, partial [bacterium]
DHNISNVILTSRDCPPGKKKEAFTDHGLCFVGRAGRKADPYSSVFINLCVNRKIKIPESVIKCLDRIIELQEPIKEEFLSVFGWEDNSAKLRAQHQWKEFIDKVLLLKEKKMIIPEMLK